MADNAIRPACRLKTSSARVSRHLSPAPLGRELAQLDQLADIYITHIEPGELEMVMAEVGRSHHKIRVPNNANAGSRVTSGKASSSLCAASMRSNGSRCSSA